MSAVLSTRSRKCGRCRNHGELVDLRGHKYFCKYSDCSCSACILLDKRRDAIRQTTALRRRDQIVKSMATSGPRRSYTGRISLPLEIKKTSQINISKDSSTSVTCTLTSPTQKNNRFSVEHPSLVSYTQPTYSKMYHHQMSTSETTYTTLQPVPHASLSTNSCTHQHPYQSYTMDGISSHMSYTGNSMQHIPYAGFAPTWPMQYASFIPNICHAYVPQYMPTFDSSNSIDTFQNYNTNQDITIQSNLQDPYGLEMQSLSSLQNDKTGLDLYLNEKQ